MLILVASRDMCAPPLGTDARRRHVNRLQAPDHEWLGFLPGSDQICGGSPGWHVASASSAPIRPHARDYADSSAATTFSRPPLSVRLRAPDLSLGPKVGPGDTSVLIGSRFSPVYFGPSLLTCCTFLCVASRLRSASGSSSSSRGGWSLIRTEAQ